MKFAIIVTIYKRPDGKSPYYLRRCIKSILNQIYDNYECFIIGDKYEGDDSEITKLIPNHFYYENRPTAYERERYNGKILWYFGGLQSTLYGIKLALNKNINNIILLDYDDYWSKDHLFILQENKPFACAFTKSTYPENVKFLPVYTGKEYCIDMKPVWHGIVKSSVCWDYSQIPLLPRNGYEEEGNTKDASDADLWIRMKEYIEKHNLRSIFINKLTCYHDTEGYVKKAFI